VLVSIGLLALAALIVFGAIVALIVFIVVYPRRLKNETEEQNVPRRAKSDR